MVQTLLCVLRTQQCSQVLKRLMLNKGFDGDQHHGQQARGEGIKCAEGGCCFSCGAIPGGISGKVPFEQSPEGGETEPCGDLGEGHPAAGIASAKA